jgi:hypothetical protein
VTITSPPDQFVTADSSITVAGSVNDIVVGTVNDQQAQVTINGVGAQVANRTFVAANVPLAMGSNLIQAIGRDRVGNFVTQEIHVSRQAATRPIIRLLSGNNQTALIGSQLSSPLVVSLVDASGSPAASKPVVFKVTQNDGLISNGGGPSPTVLATTNSQGQAQVLWTLGHRAGAGGNTVEAYSVDFDGTAIFNATGNQGPAGKIVVDTGNDQIGVIGQPLPKPMIGVVVDNGNNRLGGVPVTFTVSEGGGSFGGQPSYTVVSDSDGRVAATLTLGVQEGNGNNLVRADFPNNQSFPASFKASGRAPGDPARTTISGVVFDNSNLPVAGVTLRAVSTDVLHSNVGSVQAAIAVQTNAQGQFSIAQAPVGLVKLLVDGSTAQSQGQYPSLEYDLVTVPGQDNTVGNPIYILPLNAANQLCVTASSGGGTLTVPEAPGFSLAFSPGQVTFPGGSKSGCVGVTVVHGDKVPMTPGFGQQPRFIVTIQPAGAIFNPPAAITLPNVDGLKPRAITEMYSFDHDIGSFVAIGTGTVSDDGRLIRSNPGVGVLKAGWHCGGDPNAIGHVADCGSCRICADIGSGTCVPDPFQNGNSCRRGGTEGVCDNGNCVPKVTLASINVNPAAPTPVIGGSPTPVQVTIRLTGPAPSGGAPVSLTFPIPDWTLNSRQTGDPCPSHVIQPPTDVAVVTTSTLVPAGQDTLVVTVATKAMNYPLKVQVRGEYGGISKTADMIIVPPPIATTGFDAYTRVRSILREFAIGTPSYETYDTGLCDIIKLRNMSFEASQDIYLAAADHYLVMATMVLKMPWADLFADILPIAEGYDLLKLIAAKGPSFLSQWLATNPQYPPSPPTLLAYEFEKFGISDALQIRYGAIACTVVSCQ